MVARRARWWLRMNIRCEVLSVYLWESFAMVEIFLFLQKIEDESEAGHSGHTQDTFWTCKGTMGQHN